MNAGVPQAGADGAVEPAVGVAQPAVGVAQPAVGVAQPAVGVASVGAARAEMTAAWVGAAARVELTVTDADTAQTLGSGDVPVLGTPRVVALAEAATVAATTTRLPPGATTVGTRVDLEHRRPTPVGRTVIAEARLATADGKRLTFEVSVRDGADVVADGRIERVLVDRHRFVASAFAPAS